MTSTDAPSSSLRSILRRCLLVLALPVVLVAGQLPAAAPASAANVVNVTIHVPAQVETNPCVPGDVINLSGDIHIVITTTANNSGGYRVANKYNSQLSGVSITTGTQYVNSDTQYESWFAKPPFPVQHTTIRDFELVSKSNTDNYILHLTLIETIDANGVPTIAAYNFKADCKG